MAIFIGCKNRKKIDQLYLENILIDGTQGDGVYFSRAKGKAFYSNLQFKNVKGKNIGEVSNGFEFSTDIKTGLPQ